jgi:hypothetical protein
MQNTHRTADSKQTEAEATQRNTQTEHRLGQQAQGVQLVGEGHLARARAHTHTHTRAHTHTHTHTHMHGYEN